VVPESPANPLANVLAERDRMDVRARRGTAAEDALLWKKFARSNPGFDEYRNLATREIPVVILDSDDVIRLSHLNSATSI
jgi:hypothetical protein